MNKIEIFKTVVGTAVSIGIGAIVGNAIKATTPETTKGLMKLTVKLGSIALTAIASNAASKYTEKQVDSTVDLIKGLFIIEETDTDEIVEETEA